MLTTVIPIEELLTRLREYSTISSAANVLSYMYSARANSGSAEWHYSCWQASLRRRIRAAAEDSLGNVPIAEEIACLL